MDTSDITSIILRIHINEEELQQPNIFVKKWSFALYIVMQTSFLNWYNVTEIRLMQKWAFDWSSNQYCFLSPPIRQNLDIDLCKKLIYIPELISFLQKNVTSLQKDVLEMFPVPFLTMERKKENRCFTTQECLSIFCSKIYARKSCRKVIVSFALPFSHPFANKWFRNPWIYRMTRKYSYIDNWLKLTIFFDILNVLSFDSIEIYSNSFPLSDFFLIASYIVHISSSWLQYHILTF